MNSYKRLVPGFDAPVFITWGEVSRSNLIRIPNYAKGEGTRIELCSPDSAANPYLTLALCLEAGLDGIQNKIEPPKPVEENVLAMTGAQRKEAGIERLPETLAAALDELEKDQVLIDALGSHIASKYINAKRKECERYQTSISQWELDEYLLKY